MKRILIIEDDKDIVELVRYNLEREDFHVVAAHDGVSGLAQVKKSRPDLLLDLMLPKKLCTRLCRRRRITGVMGTEGKSGKPYRPSAVLRPRREPGAHAH